MPSVTIKARPRAMPIMPSVATNGGTRSFPMTTPFARPQAAPTSSPATRPGIRPPPCCPAISTLLRARPAHVSITMAETTVTRASTDPTPRSIPAVRMTKVWPAPSMQMTAAWTVTWSKLSLVRKYGDSCAKPNIITSRTTNMNRVWLVSR